MTNPVRGSFLCDAFKQSYLKLSFEYFSLFPADMKITYFMTKIIQQ